MNVETLYGELHRGAQSILGHRAVVTYKGVTTDVVNPDEVALAQFITSIREFVAMQGVTLDELDAYAQLLEANRLEMDNLCVWQNLRPEEEGVAHINDMRLERQVMSVIIIAIRQVLAGPPAETVRSPRHKRW